MTIIQNNFDKLYTIASDFDAPIVVDNRITIPTRNLGIIPGHPLNPSQQETIFIPKCCLVFEGVKKSIRELWHDESAVETAPTRTKSACADFKNNR